MWELAAQARLRWCAWQPRLGKIRLEGAALYGIPFLVVLDEPSSSLDSDGNHALAAAITRLKARRALVMVASNNVS